MNGISTFLQLNSALITGLLGMLGALGGVIITNYYNSKNSDKKINFDLLDKDRERKFNLRKEIYLEAVDSIVDFEAMLGGIATASSLDEFNEFHRIQTKKLKKLELISDMDISIKVADLSAHFRYLINYILTEKEALLEKERELNELVERIKVIGQKVEWFEEGGAKSYNAKAAAEAKLEYLNNNRLGQALSAEMTEKVKQLFHEQQKLAMYLLDYFDDISGLIGTIYKRFRADFGLDLFDSNRHDLSDQINLKQKINKNFQEAMGDAKNKISSL